MARRAHGAMVGWHPCVRRTRGLRAMPASGRLEPPQHRGATMATIEKPATYEPPGRPGSLVEVKDRYENFIGARGRRRRPASTARTRARDGRGVLRDRLLDFADIELALDAAHAAKAHGARPPPPAAPPCWTPSPTRSRPTSRCSRSPRAAQRACARDAQRGPARHRPPPLLRRRDPRRGGSLRARREDRRHHFREPLGVVGQIIPFNFPLLMAA
jgi:aldehyde dehydrogenase